jgi:tyrosine-protein kinase Etk/Wzc
MTTTILSSEKIKHDESRAASETLGPPATNTDEISMFDLLIVLGQRKRSIFLIASVFAVIAIIVSLILPKSYTATATLLPPQQNSSIGATLAGQLGSMGGMASLAGAGLGLRNPNDMYVAMLMSRTVEDAMVQHFGLMSEYRAKYPSDARKAFEGHAKIDGSGKDGLIRISIEDSDPRRAAELANGYVDQFRALSEHLAITEASQRRLFFEKELERAKSDLANAEEALKRTEQTTGLVQLDSQARTLIEAAASLRAQIAAREVQIEGMQMYATGQNAQLLQAQQELEGMRTQLAKLGGSEDSAASLIVSKGRVPEVGLEYARKVRDVKYYETIFDILARQFEVAKLDEAKQGALIQVVDSAIAPDRRSSPKRGRIVIGATLAGLLIGMITALFQASLRRLRDDPESAEKLGSLRSAFSMKAR